MKRGISLSCLALALVFLSPAGNAQPSPTVEASDTTIPSLPKKPEEIMKLLEQMNGLDSPDLKPWHVHGNFQLFDDDGRLKDPGTFEEW